MGKFGKNLMLALQGEKKQSSSERERLPGGVKDLKRYTVGKDIDLVFVIDTTGSMSNKIQGLLNSCSRFVDEFADLGMNYRMAIVAFGDLNVKRDKIMATGFTENVEIVQKNLRNIPRFSGGGNNGESSLQALEKMIALTFRSGAVKVAILITDEPALQDRNLTVSAVTDQLTRNEILTFVVSPSIGYFKDMAKQTGGKWYKVSSRTDFRDMLDMFRRVAEQVSQVVSDVYRLGDGSVSGYRKLNPPSGKT